MGCGAGITQHVFKAGLRREKAALLAVARGASVQQTAPLVSCFVCAHVESARPSRMTVAVWGWALSRDMVVA